MAGWPDNKVLLRHSQGDDSCDPAGKVEPPALEPLKISTENQIIEPSDSISEPKEPTQVGEENSYFSTRMNLRAGAGV